MKVKEFIYKFNYICREALKKRDIAIPINDPELSSDDIFTMSTDSAAVSIGPKTKLIHFHADVKIKYRGNSPGYFHLDRKKIQEHILTKLPLDSVYINITFVKNFKIAVDKYIQDQSVLNPDFDYEENLKKYRHHGNQEQAEEENQERNGGAEDDE